MPLQWSFLSHSSGKPQGSWPYGFQGQHGPQKSFKESQPFFNFDELLLLRVGMIMRLGSGKDQGSLEPAGAQGLPEDWDSALLTNDMSLCLLQPHSHTCCYHSISSSASLCQVPSYSSIPWNLFLKASSHETYCMLLNSSSTTETLSSKPPRVSQTTTQPSSSLNYGQLLYKQLQFHCFRTYPAVAASPCLAFFSEDITACPCNLFEQCTCTPAPSLFSILKENSKVRLVQRTFPQNFLQCGCCLLLHFVSWCSPNLDSHPRSQT